MKRLTVEVLFSFDGLTIKMILLVLQQVIFISFCACGKADSKMLSSPQRKAARREFTDEFHDVKQISGLVL
ncbi:hypothetical protein [Rossellomorea aquimaris]|uniref:Uncharacterized protein n=1 Tax=Rossellomorea aquimaris TaxID=189382 RepID=A0A1J6W5N6_9BACI|nr:hypothetical protein [Rossellomorea aquimaris]OIU72925.1 hypothetical protein BHE18_00990 [Rossellomorea aquimaris]